MEISGRNFKKINMNLDLNENLMSICINELETYCIEQKNLINQCTEFKIRNL